MVERIDIDEIILPYQDKAPGCAVTIVLDKEIAFEKTIGYADLEYVVKVSPQTNFRLASVTKHFIAVGILVLIQKHKLSFEDTLKSFFPNFPPYAQEITIHHLLTHSSGLHDYEKLIPESQTEQVDDKDVLVLLEAQEDTLFIPGTKYSYNNGGYCLLRLIIEKVSGKTIDSFLEENIFTPLDMRFTVVNYEGKTIIPNRAYGYSFKNSTWQQTDQDITSATIGDGGIYSSIEDMKKWIQLFHTDKVLRKEMRDIMIKKHILTDEGKDVYYGYGLCLKNHQGKEVAYHGGSSVGFETGVYYILNEMSAVIFLSNRSGENGSRIAEAIMEASWITV